MRYANVKGLALAAGIVAIEIAVVAYGLSLDGITPPTTIAQTPDAFAPLALPVSPDTVVPRDQPGDAGTLIRSAIDDYLADPGRYEAFIEHPDAAEAAKLTAIQKVLAATHLRDPHGPLADRIDAAIVYGESPTVTALQQVGVATIKAGETLQASDPARAWNYFAAAFSLGARAFDERLSYRELNAGNTLLGTSAAWLATIAERTGRAHDAVNVARFRDAFTPFVKSRVLPTIEAIYTFDEAKIGQHAGDVVAFATRSDERVWRIESILKLGRTRFDPGSPGRIGDQRNAERVLESIATDDPATSRAITLARGLTLEQFRTLR